MTVKCEVCGKELKFGKKVFYTIHTVGFYCSPKCFGEMFLRTVDGSGFTGKPLTNEVIEHLHEEGGV